MVAGYKLGQGERSIGDVNSLSIRFEELLQSSQGCIGHCVLLSLLELKETCILFYVDNGLQRIYYGLWLYFWLPFDYP